MLSSVVSVRDLQVDHHGRAVVQLPSWSVQAGELWHLQGANGAGKTSLLRALSGELACSGELLICGARPGSLEARRSALLVPTEADLLPDLSVQESLVFMAAAWERDASPLLALAQSFGLKSFLDAWPEELSRGTRQKVALAAALGLELPLTMLDEPFATLDTGSRAVLLGAIRERTAAGGTVIMTTHGQELTGLDAIGLELDTVTA